MRQSSLSGFLTGGVGVGRRILTLFLLAGLLPVIFTAYLSFHELNRGLTQEVQKSLRDSSKNYGVEILDRLNRFTEKAEEIGRIVGASGNGSLRFHDYLVNDFDSIWLSTAPGRIKKISGSNSIDIDRDLVNRGHLKAGKAQLLQLEDDGKPALVMLISAERNKNSNRILAFRIRPEALWGQRENLPYKTDYCLFSTGSKLFCTEGLDEASERIAVSNEWLVHAKPVDLEHNGEGHFLASWQLFLDGPFAHPPIDIVSSRPQSYALNATDDFRRIFPPALALVIILVCALSFNLIGRSLVPLKRLTFVAQQYASGELQSRVRFHTGDEFEALGDAFNNMADRLGRQIDTMKAMSEIDRMILSGTNFDEVSETVIGHLISLTGCEAAAVIARDSESPNRARMTSFSEGEFVRERIGLPQELGFEWCQPREVSLDIIDESVAPYKARFASYECKYVVIIPVIRNDELKGILLLGSETKFDMKERLNRCVDLAGRLAVALASAEREEELYRQAHFDELTGLPNRQLLKDRLEQQVVQARRDQSSGAMLFLDLDRFKEINDVFGHSIGDVVLAQAAERIVSEVRESDTVARLGGDEFVVVMPQAPVDNPVSVMASRLLQRMEEAFSVRGKDHFLSASIGIVLFPDDGDSVETLLKNADAAMYRAKDAGRSRFEFFSAKLNAESRRKIELERELREAHRDGMIGVCYQPQFDLMTGVISGAEALARWPHPERGDVPPAEFIPLAEDSGLIADIGRFVIEQTCSDLSKILFLGLHPGPMSINVSAMQLRDPNFAKQVLDAMQQYEIHPGFLQLEITETTVAQNRDTAIDVLNVLREAGVTVAIDDFGTGYSSLSYLQQLPFDLIKIDKSFIDLIGSGDNSENICRTIIKMAHELGKQAIAEGVETDEQAAFLTENGCDFVQGYLYSKVLPQAEFVAFVQKQEFHTQRRKALEIA